MSTASQSIFRMIENGKELSILLTNSQDYDFGKVTVCPVHIHFSDGSCFPYVIETAHHTKASDEANLLVNQKQKMAYLLGHSKVVGIRCKLYKVKKQTFKDGAGYYAFAQVK